MLGQQGLSLLAFVVDGKAIDQGGTGVVQADDRHLFPLTAELDDHLVEGRDGGDVPEVGVCHVDDHGAALGARLSLPPGVTLDQLARADIPALCAALAAFPAAVLFSTDCYKQCGARYQAPLERAA